MPFNLFHKKKQPEQQTLTQPTQETSPEGASVEQPQSTQEATPEPTTDDGQLTQESTPEPALNEEQPQENQSPPPEQQQSTTASEEQIKEQVQTVEKTVEQNSGSSVLPDKRYLKAMPLKDLTDVETVKSEVINGNIIILRITPLAGKSIEDVKTAVNDLFQFVESIDGDIARLGEERVVICPKPVRIWREKTPAPVSSNKPLPTAA
ncbi:MAG: cell division protein SepF [Crenarchaeota archaeon]|jgi:SepF-like predicted cell division protein (DUF552 family)|nr:cell division protein SepF [Thermoproteota archaeon]